MERTKAAIIAAILVVAFLGIGYMSLSSSSYKKVSELAGLDRKSKVTVEGTIVPIGKGEYTLYIDGKTYTVDAMGSYGVARDAEGNVYAVFILGDQKFQVLAFYDVGDNYVAFQTGSALKSSVVVSATYDPNDKATLVTPSGTIQLPLLKVDSILKGCHESYKQESATIG